MTSEIEKQFFKAFGIKAYYKYLLIDKTTKWCREKLLDKANFIDFVRSGKDYLLLKVVKHYPQITDRILLELSALCQRKTYDEYKNECLIKTIEIMGGNAYKISQVQALFKENN